VKVLRACAILHNYVLNKDKILLDDKGDENIKDGPIHMGYYPIRLDPNVEEDKIIIDRLHSSVPGQSVVREALVFSNCNYSVLTLVENNVFQGI